MKENYSTIISCTKVSRSLGLLASQTMGPKDDSNKNCLFGNVDKDILEKSITHRDEQVDLLKKNLKVLRILLYNLLSKDKT